jgi:maltose alpha-D-glucosyltransferase/alpha-amylase
MGVGLIVVEDKIGENNNLLAMGTYSYKIEFEDMFLSFGLQGGIANYRSDNLALNIEDETDPYFAGNQNITKPVFGAGLILHNNNFFLGLSVPRMLQNKETFGSGIDEVEASLYTQHFYGMASYIFFLNERIRLKPSVLFKYVKDNPISTDINALLNIDERKIALHKMIPLKVEGSTHYLTLIEVHYVQRLPELYFLPMTFILADNILDKVEYTAQSVICRAEIQGKSGFILDSSYDKSFRDFLLVSMDKKVRVKDDEGVLEFNSSVFNKIKIPNDQVDSKILKAEQSNTSIIYNDQYFFKFYRKIEKEINPDLEIVRFLSEHTSFANSPRYAGSVEYKDEEGKVIVFGLLQEKVENQGEAWGMATDSVGRFFERVIVKAKKEKLPKLINSPSIKFEEAPEIIQEFIGRGFYERVVRLGQRTAEMHLALASDQTNPAFTPENFTANYQRSLYSSLRKLVRDRFSLLESSLPKLDADTKELAQKVLEMEKQVLECMSEIYQVKINSVKTRIHGDYHLGQVLFTGKDFVIIDFEGEPGFSFSERRLKKNPLKDVAGMMRSFHYAAFGKILLNENYRDRDLSFLESWAEQWQHYVSRFYLGAYMERMGMGRELSKENDLLIRIFLIEKAIYELGYELNGRPDWVNIPLRGIYYHMNRYFQEKEQSDKKKK